jgi:membrane dipeptidase
VAIPIFDGHNDTLTQIFQSKPSEKRSFFEESAIGHLDLPRAKKGGLCGGIFAIFAPAPPDSPEREPYYGFKITEQGYSVNPGSALSQPYAQEFTDGVIDYLYQLEAQSEGEMKVVQSYSQLEDCLQSDVLAVVLHFEDAAAIKSDLSNLESYYHRGLRSLGVVWSRPNAFGCGVPFKFPASPDTGDGLSKEGKALVRECNRLGIMLDLSHMNEKGFWDCVRLTSAPLVVTHTAAHAICASTRNLTDAQIDAVGASHGVIGIYFVTENIREDGKKAGDTPLEQILRHIDYVVERIGADHVAFGSDFDGADVPVELGDASGLPKLVALLSEKGYDAQSIRKIANGNWLRVLRDTWKAYS